MKVILEFDGNEDKEAIEDAMNGSKYKDQIDEIWQRCFRPAYKHLYNNQRINELLEGEHSDAFYEVIDYLAKIYSDIKNGTD